MVPRIKPRAPCKLGRKSFDSTGLPGIKVLEPDENPFWMDNKSGNSSWWGGPWDSKFFTIIIQIAQGLGEGIWAVVPDTSS
ncbi:hypothetical protein U0070_018461 [Myodes glareolus]|uniref:Uncharacterized protein n=1 Tax=Myodes glareolus TaxID=447135 RepID=A0AAW0JVX3_MYOGA